MEQETIFIIFAILAFFVIPLISVFTRIGK